ncbi:MAG: hypothetical protein AABZ06_01735 [Bdellovibrionota bacterium]|mgnify:CR=1 FL=1
MRTEDLKTFSVIGNGIWPKPEDSRHTTAETLAAVSLLDLEPDRAVERAAVALLKRAVREGDSISAKAARSSLNTHSFFRLSAEERFILIALHFGKWSYSRLSRILHAAGNEAMSLRLEEVAWSARTRLAFSAMRVSYPVGAGSGGPHCPSYDPAKPWTQRFLDDEIVNGTERIFLQNHLMACDSCRRGLALAREVYFAVETLIPQPSDESFLKDLSSVCKRGYLHKAPSQRSVMEALSAFTKRPDVQWILIAWLIVVAVVLAWQAM